ncbi:TPA: hypothetical protein ACF3L6_004587, partial [Shigella sonnei]
WWTFPSKSPDRNEYALITSPWLITCNALAAVVEENVGRSQNSVFAALLGVPFVRATRNELEVAAAAPVTFSQNVYR